MRAGLRGQCGLDPNADEPKLFSWAQARDEVEELRNRLGIVKGDPRGDVYPCPRCNNKTGREWGLCKQCVIGHAALIEADSPEGFRHRQRLAKYDITPTDYTKLYFHQRGSCAICREVLTPSETHVDHDHETDKVRGLLCRLCNAGLGFFKDNRSAIRRADKYLRRPPIKKALIGPWTPPTRKAKRSLRWQHKNKDLT